LIYRPLLILIICHAYTPFDMLSFVIDT